MSDFKSFVEASIKPDKEGLYRLKLTYLNQRKKKVTHKVCGEFANLTQFTSRFSDPAELCLKLAKDPAPCVQLPSELTFSFMPNVTQWHGHYTQGRLDEQGVSIWFNPGFVIILKKDSRLSPQPFCRSWSEQTHSANNKKEVDDTDALCDASLQEAINSLREKSYRYQNRFLYISQEEMRQIHSLYPVVRQYEFPLDPTGKQEPCLILLEQKCAPPEKLWIIRTAFRDAIVSELETVFAKVYATSF